MPRRPQPPRQDKAPRSPQPCPDEAVRQPRRVKPLIAADVWSLEAVRGRGDSEVARIAELQRGIVARSQLLQAELSPAAIKHRLKVGQLHPLYPGVYVFGRPRLEPLAAATAAVIHAQGGGVLSHGTAAGIWGMSELQESPVQLSVASGRIRPRVGLTVHRRRPLSQADVRVCRNLPVTSPARTIVDLAGVLDGHELEAALALAIRRALVTPQEVTDALARAPKSKGAATVKELLTQGPGPTLTRSKYERKLIQLLKRADLPMPVINSKAEGHEVDLLWPEQRLIVEFDGFAYHSDRSAFEQDRLRDQRLVAAGYRVIRITARQLNHTPEAVVARIAAALVHR